MKIKLLIIAFAFSSVINAQELSFSLSNTHVSQFGKETDLVGFNPLFKLDADSIHNKKQSAKIKRLPKTINKSKTAYGFIMFTGVDNSIFDGELTILVEDYTSNSPTVFVDRNGNLDFTDDGEPLGLRDPIILKLNNSNENSAIYNYRIARSQITEQNEKSVRKRYASKFPNSSIVSAAYWLTNQRLQVRVSNGLIDNRHITIFLFDNSVDGLFTFQTDNQGDRILILEGEINTSKDISPLIRQAEPIDHNAVFELFDKNYYVKKVSKNGSSVTIAETNKNTRVIFKDGQDVSSFTIELLDGSSVMIKDLLIGKKNLLIDVGGTWCGGCISQEPTIKKIYEAGIANIIGIFNYDTPESVTKYVNSHNIKWPVALASSTFKEMFRVNSYPTYILVSPKGKIVLSDMNAGQIAKYLSDNKPGHH